MLDQMARAGYEGLELGRVGYLPLDPGQLGEAITARDLAMVGGFIVEPLAGEELDADDVCDKAERLGSVLAAVGARHLVVIDAIRGSRRSLTAGRSAVAERLEGAGWDELVETTSRIAAIAADHGLTTAFHHHAGTRIEFEDEVERLLADTDPTQVGLCLDTGHAIYAGFDPIDFYLRHRERVHYLHLKDVDGARLARSLEQEHDFQAAVAAGVFCPLGDGELDLLRLHEALDQGGFDGWATVEQDRLTEKEISAEEDARTSMERLRAAGIAPGRRER